MRAAGVMVKARGKEYSCLYITHSWTILHKCALLPTFTAENFFLFSEHQRVIQDHKQAGCIVFMSSRLLWSMKGRLCRYFEKKMVLSVFFGGVEVVIISTHMSGQYPFWRSQCRIQIIHIFTQSSLREKDFCWVIAVLIHTVVTDGFCRKKRQRVQFLLCWVDGKTEKKERWMFDFSSFHLFVCSQKTKQDSHPHVQFKSAIPFDHFKPRCGNVAVFRFDLL